MAPFLPEVDEPEELTRAGETADARVSASTPPGAVRPSDSPKVVFSTDEREIHRGLRTPLWAYLCHTNFRTALSAPLIYVCVIPFALLDLLITVYQTVCFPIYRIPQVRRSAYFLFDRHKLMYLNLLEKVNCTYCAYANGLLAYVTEIAARTEQHWCPIRHSLPMPPAHSRHRYFLPYGDAQAYRTTAAQVRNSFGDLEA